MIDVSNVVFCPTCGNPHIRAVNEILEHSASDAVQLLSPPLWAQKDAALTTAAASFWHCARCHTCFCLQTYDICHDQRLWQYLARLKSRK